MAESLLEGKEERADLNKIKMKKEFFEKVEAFVKKSTFFSKMLKFNGKEASYSEFFKKSEIKKSWTLCDFIWSGKQNNQLTVKTIN